MHVLIACKYEKDQMKNSGTNVITSFSPLFEPYLDLFMSLYDSFAEIRNYSIFFLAFFVSSFRVTEED